MSTCTYERWNRCQVPDPLSNMEVWKYCDGWWWWMMDRCALKCEYLWRFWLSRSTSCIAAKWKRKNRESLGLPVNPNLEIGHGNERPGFFASLLTSSLLYPCWNKQNIHTDSHAHDASHATNRHTNRKLSCLWKSLSSFLHFIRSIFGSTSAVSLLKFPRLRLDWHLRHYE